MSEPATIPTAGTRVQAGDALALPPLGLGAWAWGDRAVWGMNGYDSGLTLDSIRAALHASVRAGVTLVDTAEMYGRGESERIIGRLLEEAPEIRSRVQIATKFMPYPWLVPFDRSLRRALEASLERLRLPHVDLYQIHGPISLRSAETVADALANVQSAGLVRAVGVSNYSARETRAVDAALRRRGLRLATNQVEYSLLRTRPERSGLLNVCRELGVAVLAYSPIGQGRLTGKYDSSHPPPGSRNFSAYPMAEIEPLLGELRRLGALHGGRSPSQVALNWLLCKDCVPIPGAKNAGQAEQNAGALGWRLEAAEVAELDRVAKPGLRRLMHVVWQHG